MSLYFIFLSWGIVSNLRVYKLAHMFIDCMLLVYFMLNAASFTGNTTFLGKKKDILARIRRVFWHGVDFSIMCTSS